MTIVIPDWIIFVLTMIGWGVLITLAITGALLLWSMRDVKFWR